MPIVYAVDSSQRLTVSRCCGELRVPDVAAYFRAVAGDKRIRHGMNRIVDLREIATTLSTADVRSLADLYRQSPLRDSARVVVIATDDLTFGLAMMFAGLAGLSGRLQAFRDLPSARAWLAQPPARF